MDSNTSMIIAVACLIVVVSLSVIVMGCCFIKRTKPETRTPTTSLSLPRPLATNTYTYSGARDQNMPSCSHHGQTNRTARSGYDKLRIGQDNLLKFIDTESDPEQMYSHLARQDADWAGEDIYDTTQRTHGRKKADKSYDKVTIQDK